MRKQHTFFLQKEGHQDPKESIRLQPGISNTHHTGINVDVIMAHMGATKKSSDLKLNSQDGANLKTEASYRALQRTWTTF